MTEFIHEEINADNSAHTDTQVTDNTPDPIEERTGPESVRETVEKSWNEHNPERKFDDPLKKGPKQRDHTGKFVKGAAPATDKPQEQVSAPVQAATPSDATKQDGPPQWSAEGKALLSQLTPQQQQILTKEWQKREADSKAGFEKFKSRYTEMEREAGIFAQELNGVMPSLQSLNVSPGTFIRDGIRWFKELSGPNRVQAAGKFLQTLGIDPQQVAGYAPATPQQDPVVGQLYQRVTGMAQDLESWKAEKAANERNKVISDIENWKKDKPHFESVRGEMAKLIGAGYYIENGYPNYDKLYEHATWSNPEVRALMQQEAATKQAEQQQKAIAAQRHAGRTLPGNKSPGAAMKPNQKLNGKVESARETVMRSMHEVNG